MLVLFFQKSNPFYIVAFKDRNIYNVFEFPKKVKNIQKITDLLEIDVDKSFYYSSKFKNYPLLKDEMRNKNSVYQWRRVYLRENKNGLCPTLIANMGMGGHNVPLILDSKGIRKLTPRECARFQGFPETYKLAKLACSAL